MSRLDPRTTGGLHGEMTIQTKRWRCMTLGTKQTERMQHYKSIRVIPLHRWAAQIQTQGKREGSQL